MPSLNQICQAVADTVKNYSQLEIFTYPSVVDKAEFPAVMVEPEQGEFAQEYGGKMSTWMFNVYVMCASGADIGTAQAQMNTLIDGYGPNSIRRILLDHRDLNLPKTDCIIKSVRAFGGSFESATIQAVGAIMSLMVITDSSA